MSKTASFYSQCRWVKQHVMNIALLHRRWELCNASSQKLQTCDWHGSFLQQNLLCHELYPSAVSLCSAVSTPCESPGDPAFWKTSVLAKVDLRSSEARSCWWRGRAFNFGVGDLVQPQTLKMWKEGKFENQALGFWDCEQSTPGYDPKKEYAALSGELLA